MRFLQIVVAYLEYLNFTTRISGFSDLLTALQYVQRQQKFPEGESISCLDCLIQCMLVLKGLKGQHSKTGEC